MRKESTRTKDKDSLFVSLTDSYERVRDKIPVKWFSTCKTARRMSGRRCLCGTDEYAHHQLSTTTRGAERTKCWLLSPLFYSTPESNSSAFARPLSSASVIKHLKYQQHHGPINCTPLSHSGGCQCLYVPLHHLSVAPTNTHNSSIDDAGNSSIWRGQWVCVIPGRKGRKDF